MGNYKFSSLNKAYMACGHNSVLRDDDGKWYLFYHARFDDGSEYHEVRVHSMYFNEDGWPVVAPFEYSGDEISAAAATTRLTSSVTTNTSITATLQTASLSAIRT